MKTKLRNVVVGLVICVMLSMMVGLNVVQAEDYTSAETLGFNATWGSEKYITETNSVDWYKIVIPSDGKWRYKVMSYTYRTYTNLYNYDFSHHIVAREVCDGSESQPSTATFDVVLSEGTYYLRVDGYHGKYKMYSEFTSYGVNDLSAVSYDSPQNYLLGSMIIGAITNNDGEDWYKINVPNDGTYHMELTTYAYRAYVNLFNYDLSHHIAAREVCDGSENQPSVENYDFILSQGTYYLKIDGYHGKYKFVFSKLTPEMCTHEYSTKHTQYATYFDRGYTIYYCSRCGDEYTEYTSKLLLGQGGMSDSMYSGKRKIYARWYTVTDASGYKLRYSTKKSMKNAKVMTIKGQTQYTKTLKGLRKRKKYYLQIRPYVKSGKKIAYGKWSAKVIIKTK